MVRVSVVLGGGLVAAVAAMNARAASTFRGGDVLLKAADEEPVFEPQDDPTVVSVGEDEGEGDEIDDEYTEAPLPEGCLLGDWEPLTECDTATLTQWFERKVASATEDPACQDETQLRRCKPVHCSMGPWSEWSPCDAAGFMERARAHLDGPKYGGRKCPHSVDRERCRPDDCLVGPWSDWVCDDYSGRKTRAREILREPKHAYGRKCPADLEEEAACDPVGCELSDEYEDTWGECDADGQQHRDRKIKTEPQHGGYACPPREEVWDSRRCGPQDCVVQDEHDAKFSECALNEDSNEWYKTKVLAIVAEPEDGGQPCPSESERTIVELCPSQECVMDEWIYDGPCSAQGTRRATRAVLTQAKYGAPECEDLETEMLDLETCVPSDCDEYMERVVSLLDCDKVNANGGGGGPYSDESKQHFDAAVAVRPKIVAFKSQPRYGGRACRPVSECAVEALCKAKKQQQQQQQSALQM